MSDSETIIAELESEFVELYKILKFEGLADSGGNGGNGEIETRKRKKIKAGDQIDFIDHHIDVIARADG